MNIAPALLALLALFAPAFGGVPDASQAQLLPRPEVVAAPAAETRESVDPTDELAAAQVRIERRVTVRIAPIGPAMRDSLIADVRPVLPRMSERKMGKCVPVAAIAAVQPDAGSRLLLFMRDRRLISASLEKACSARDFYSGFYIERSADGMLCVDRDRLQSRTGSQCQVSRMRQLVADDD